MRTSSILILTASHLCRNPRVVKEATTLGAAGYDVTVMSVSVREDFERMDNELSEGLPFRRSTIDHTGKRRLTSVAQRASTWLARQMCSRFGIESAESLGPAWALLRSARSFPADLIIAHTEAPLWAAQYLIDGGRRVAVDLEDWYSEDLLEADRRSRPLHLLRKAEERALRQAVYVSVPSHSMADALCEVHGTRPVVIRNSFPLSPYFRNSDAVNDDNPPRFVWFSQTIGPGRGLEEFFAAWSTCLHSSTVSLIGGARSDYCESLLATVPMNRRRDISVVPLMSPDELSKRLADFDVGLALESTLPRNRDLTITNKILQYMNAGLAVVATPTSGQREIMSQVPGCGVVVPPLDRRTFAAQLDHLIERRDVLRVRQRTARAAAESTFSWEHDAGQLLASVERAISTAMR